MRGRIARLERQAAEASGAGMSAEEFAAERGRTDWKKHARLDQLPPKEWRDGTRPNHVRLGGRGSGKTRSGSETVRWWHRTVNYVNLIGATAADVRDVMINGPAGIMECCPRWERPRYIPSTRRLEWPNGHVSLTFSADEPDRLRGQNSGGLWMDELAAWRYPDTFTQAMFGLRLGKMPRLLVTTTPRPTKLIRDLIANPATIVTRSTSYDNRANLAAGFFEQHIKPWENTRIGRQELLAEVLDDNPGALWQRDRIDELRVDQHPPLRRIVVAVDPAVTAHEGSDETGIVVAGIGEGPGGDEHVYVLADRSLSASPETWCRAAIMAYHEFQADRIVGEANQGGDLIETMLRTIDRSIPYQKVIATRGKLLRAEPVAAQYERGVVHHVGMFAKLEDQLADWNPSAGGRSPDRLDALVWAITELSGVSTSGLFDLMRAEYERLQSPAAAQAEGIAP